MFVFAFSTIRRENALLACERLRMAAGRVLARGEPGVAEKRSEVTANYPAWCEHLSNALKRTDRIASGDLF